MLDLIAIIVFTAGLPLALMYAIRHATTRPPVPAGMVTEWMAAHHAFEHDAALISHGQEPATEVIDDMIAVVRDSEAARRARGRAEAAAERISPVWLLQCGCEWRPLPGRDALVRPCPRHAHFVDLAVWSGELSGGPR